MKNHVAIEVLIEFYGEMAPQNTWHEYLKKKTVYNGKKVDALQLALKPVFEMGVKCYKSHLRTRDLIIC